MRCNVTDPEASLTMSLQGEMHYPFSVPFLIRDLSSGTSLVITVCEKGPLTKAALVANILFV